MNKPKFLLLTLQLLVILFIQSGYTLVSRAETTDSGTQLVWEELHNKKPPRQDPPAGSRGDICPIAPAVLRKKGIVWSDRPLFLWRGSMGKIEIRLRNSQQALWSKTVTENDRNVMYDGEALRPGQAYDWVMFNERSVPLLRVTFEVIGGTERDRISSDLTRLETQLKQENATEEKIAYAKAEYFADRQMWADVFQQAYGVKNPSEDLSKFKENITQRFCS